MERWEGALNRHTRQIVVGVLSPRRQINLPIEPRVSIRVRYVGPLAGHAHRADDAGVHLDADRGHVVGDLRPELLPIMLLLLLLLLDHR